MVEGDLHWLRILGSIWSAPVCTLHNKLHLFILHDLLHIKLTTCPPTPLADSSFDVFKQTQLSVD